MTHIEEKTHLEVWNNTKSAISILDEFLVSCSPGLYNDHDVDEYVDDDEEDNQDEFQDVWSDLHAPRHCPLCLQQAPYILWWRLFNC